MFSTKKERAWSDFIMDSELITLFSWFFYGNLDLTYVELRYEQTDDNRNKNMEKVEIG